MTNPLQAAAPLAAALVLVLAGCSAPATQSPAPDAAGEPEPTVAEPTQTPEPTADEIVAELTSQQGPVNSDTATALAAFTPEEVETALDAHWQATTEEAIKAAGEWFTAFCQADQTADWAVLEPVYLSGAIRYQAAECEDAITKQLGESVFLEAFVLLGKEPPKGGAGLDVGLIPLPTALGKGKLPKLSGTPKSGGTKAAGKFLVIDRTSSGDALEDLHQYLDGTQLAQNAEELANIILITTKYKKVSSGGGATLYQCNQTVYGVEAASQKYYQKKTVNGTKTDVTGAFPVGNEFWLRCPDLDDAVAALVG
ncbi:MAG: hypothetical protein LBR58_09835 [Propionibacteriaceae bacterium]|nr:hypothetical protein [Propionibacteriaceae bacterium]